MTPPAVAIIIPHYNDAIRLARCLDALAPQLRDGIEAIVVDNNSPEPPERFWDSLPVAVQTRVIEKGLSLYCIDAYQVAADCGLGKRINTIMQNAGLLPQ